MLMLVADGTLRERERELSYRSAPHPSINPTLKFILYTHRFVDDSSQIGWMRSMLLFPFFPLSMALGNKSCLFPVRDN